MNWDITRTEYYKHIHITGRGRKEPRWRGIRIVKYPTDLILYAEVIQKRKPDYIIEAGTRFGGSALFFADMLTLNGGKKVITIDPAPASQPEHPLIDYVIGLSTEQKVIDLVKEKVKDGSVMVVLDSDHSTKNVLAELNAYKDIVTKGQYIVVEDCYTRRITPYLPYYAVHKFLKENKGFKLYDLEKKYIFAVSRGGWLRKI